MKAIQRVSRWMAAGLVLMQFLSYSCIHPLQAASLEFGPLVHEFELTLEPANSMEALGPLYYKDRGESMLRYGFPPVYSQQIDNQIESMEWDFLYPLATYDKYGDEFRFQFLQLFAFSGGRTQADDLNQRTTLFPFYFRQRSENPEEKYTAFFPFYGTIKNRLLRDEVNVVMWPLYIKSRKRDIVTRNYLYPIFHLRDGERLRGWKVWPIVGREEKESFRQVNRFNEAEVVPGHRKFNMMWPLFYHNDLGLGTENPEAQRVFLPFYSIFRSPLKRSYTFLWPFGPIVNRNEEKGFREFAFPWPFVQFARGEGKTENRVWPIYHHLQRPDVERKSVLWPIYRFRKIEASPVVRTRHRILFFLFSNIKEFDSEAETARRRWDLWPFFSRTIEHDGRSRLNLLSLLKPILPNNKGIARNYTPLWSIWRSARNPNEGTSSQSLLWNLYRRETSKDSKKCSLLFGLFRYEAKSERKRWRFLFIPFGGSSRPSSQID